jgi:hypothetical protein
VFVKHFELEQAGGVKRRLETRFLIHGQDERYYGVTYKWRPDNTDAELVGPKAVLEEVGEQTWHYPSRSECGRCHNSAANYVLGPKTAQFNRPLHYASSGLTANMVNTLQGLGLFRKCQPCMREPHSRKTVLALTSMPTVRRATDRTVPRAATGTGATARRSTCKSSLGPCQ